MKFKRHASLLFAVLMTAFISIGPVTMMADTTIVVKPSMMDGWRFRTAGGTITSTVGFDPSGPPVPPAGSTSALFTTGSDINSFAEFRNVDYHGQSLSSITSLNYWTYVKTRAPGSCVAGFILLSVDVDGNGIFDPVGGPDDGIFFEPCYQTGTSPTDPPGQIIPVQNGGVVSEGTWQMWDAFAGGWWSAKYGGDPLGGPPLTLLSNYIARLASLDFPNPKIANSDACLGGVRIRAGEGGTWPLFEGNIDKFTIGISGVNTTYDFEHEALPIPPCGVSPASTITACKFYDFNANGVIDGSDIPLNGWPITINPLGAAIPNQATQLTSGAGCVSWANLDTGLNPYTVSEGTPVQPNWFHSTPASVNVNVTFDQTSTINFGNYCKVPSGGFTIGFWGNKNGLALVSAADFAALNLLKLVNANGSDRDFLGSLSQNRNDLKSWLSGATAKNMAYMLSAQLAATTLNVLHGFIDPNSFAVCYNGTVAELLNAANAALLADQNTPSGDPNRSLQESLKNCLDSLNNGGLVIPPTPCAYSFAQQQAAQTFGGSKLSSAPARFGGKVLFP